MCCAVRNFEGPHATDSHCHPVIWVMVDKEWSTEGEVLTTSGMKDGGREQVQGCSRQRRTVALEVKEPCLERCPPRQVMLLGTWQTKADGWAGTGGGRPLRTVSVPSLGMEEGTATRQGSP